jgi:hypothetical protein
MSNTDHTKSGGKSGQRKRKREQQVSQKLEQPQKAMPEQLPDASEPSEAAVASTDTSSMTDAATASDASTDASSMTEAATASTDASPMTDAATASDASTDASPMTEAATAPTDTSPTGAAASANASPVGLQTIASAYRDYTKKSFADAQCFVEKLSGARSLDKALEVQTEFAKQAYETFMADSWRIRALYGELVRQTLTRPMGHRDR